jgi:cell division protein FtsB
MQRDLFYIYQKLMRMLRSKILEDMDTGYTRLLSMPWNFLNGGVDFDSYDELRGFQFIYSSDLVRETLKTMVRLNKMLQEENVTLVDSIDILEQDLQLSINQFRELLEDGKAKNTKNLRKFERSHRSIIQESSVILDGIRVKNKRQKKQNDDSIIESTRELQDELASIKKTNEILKKEIETFKGAPKNPSTGTGSSTAPKMDSLLLSVIQVS